MNNLIKIVLFIAILFGGYKLIDSATKSRQWTLMVCETQMADGGCYDIYRQVAGYPDHASCFAAGGPYKEMGFECGRGCKTTSYGMNVCKEICNNSGCSN